MQLTHEQASELRFIPSKEYLYEIKVATEALEEQQEELRTLFNKGVKRAMESIIQSIKSGLKELRRRPQLVERKLKKVLKITKGDAHAHHELDGSTLTVQSGFFEATIYGVGIIE
jgi:ribosomal protein L22